MKTKILFRRWKGPSREIVAIMPEIDAGGGCVVCFTHFVQHFHSPMKNIMDRTYQLIGHSDPDVNELINELSRHPYNYEVEPYRKWPVSE